MRQRNHADGASRADPVIRSPDLRKELRAAVDDLRVIAELGRRVHHAEQLHDADDPIEAAQLRAQRREDRQAGLPGGRAARGDIEIGADAAARYSEPSQRSGP